MGCGSSNTSNQVVLANRPKGPQINKNTDHDQAYINTYRHNDSVSISRTNIEPLEGSVTVPPDQYAVFLSYSWTNETLIQPIHARLNKQAIKYWYGKDEHHSGSLTKEIATIIDTSSVFVCCLSKEYSNSVNKRIELNYARLKRKKVLFYVCDIPVTDKIGYRKLLATFSDEIQACFFDQFLYTHQNDIDSLMDAVRMGLEDVKLCTRYSLLESACVNEFENALICNCIPSIRNKYYLHRPQLFDSITDELERNQFCVLTGLPGVGKSTYARHYAHDQMQCCIVRWINVESSLCVDIRGIAIELNIDADRKELKGVFSSILQKLRAQRTLFIFDNVTKYDEISMLFQDTAIYEETFSVLITSRNPRLTDTINSIKVAGFSKQEAKQCLQSRLKITDGELNELLRMFGSDNQNIMPIDVELTESYINQTGIPCKMADFVRSKRSVNELLNEVFLDFRQSASQAIWILFKYICVLSPDFIQIDLLQRLLDLKYEDLQDHLDHLQSYSLIDLVLNSSKLGVKVHRTVRSKAKVYWCCQSNAENDNRILYRSLLTQFNRLLPEFNTRPSKDWSYIGHLVLQLEAFFCSFPKLDSIEPKLKATLIFKMQCYYTIVNASFQKMLDYGFNVLKYLNKFHQNDHVHIATCLNNIGLASGCLGKLTKSLEFTTQSLEMYKRLHKTDHGDIVMCLSTIGHLYDHLGQSSKCLVFYLQAHGMLKRLYGDETHPDILLSLNQLATLYDSLEQQSESLGYYLQALAILQRLIDFDHPDIAECLYNIGNSYDAIGELSKSFEYKLKAREMYSRLYLLRTIC